MFVGIAVVGIAAVGTVAASRFTQLLLGLDIATIVQISCLHLQRALIRRLAQLQVISSIHESGTGTGTGGRDMSVGTGDTPFFLHLIV